MRKGLKFQAWRVLMGSLEALILEILYKTEVNQWSDGTFEDGFIAAAELEV